MRNSESRAYANSAAIRITLGKKESNIVYVTYRLLLSVLSGTIKSLRALSPYVKVIQSLLSVSLDLPGDDSHQGQREGAGGLRHKVTLPCGIQLTWSVGI